MALRRALRHPALTRQWTVTAAPLRLPHGLQATSGSSDEPSGTPYQGGVLSEFVDLERWDEDHCEALPAGTRFEDLGIKVRIIDSVSAAIDGLNEGRFSAPSGVCVVTSASTNMNYTLWSRKVPRMIYGTYDKLEATNALVSDAVFLGFVGIDTAPQRKHYLESKLGDALELMSWGGVKRHTLFIQGKFDREYAAETNPNMTIAEQVNASIRQSLSDLKQRSLDCLLLDSPYPDHEQTMEAWRAMEGALRAGLVKELGVANVESLEQLTKLYTDATQKPAFLQQPLYGRAGFERRMVKWCAENGVMFQSMLTLAAFAKLTDPELFARLAKDYKVDPEVLFYRYVMGLGVLPIIGSGSEHHLKDNLIARNIPLSREHAEVIGGLLPNTTDETWYGYYDADYAEEA